MKKIFLSLMAAAGIVCSMQAAETVVFKNIGERPSLVYRWKYCEPQLIEKGGPQEQYAIKMTKIGVLRLNEKKLAGKKVKLSAMIKAEEVKETHKGGGVAFQIRYREANGKLRAYSRVDKADRFGSYDWKPMVYTLSIPADAQEVAIGLGLQNTTGTVYFSAVNVSVIE